MVPFFGGVQKEDDPSSLYRKILVFRERRTGEVEKVIDCAVSSQIEISRGIRRGDLSLLPSKKTISASLILTR